MKKILWVTCVLGAMLSSCTNDSKEPKEGVQQLEKKTFTALANGATKVAWNSPLDLSWEMVDQIEAFDNEGNRLVFDAVSVNDNSATFSATGSLSSGALAVFSPAQDLAGNTYTIDATGQTQNGNGSFAHLANKTYLLGHTTLEAGSNTFAVAFSQIMAQFKWTVELPTNVTAENIAAVQMKAASNAFKSAVTYTVVNGVATPNSGTPTDEVGVAMTNMTGATSPITAYMLAIPTTLSNETLEVVAENAAGDVLAYKQYTGVNMSYVGGQIYNGSVGSMTATAPSTTSWDTQSYTDIYGVGTTTVTEVASDDGVSKIQYININGGNPQNFLVVTEGDDSPYLEVDNMNTNNAFVLEFPIYETATKYRLTFEIKNLTSKNNTTDDLELKLQHREANESSWTDMTVTDWSETDIATSTVLNSGTSNAMLVTQADNFNRLTIDFTFSEAEKAKYDKKTLFVAVDKLNTAIHDVAFKILSLEVVEQ